jgi:hypothetical protein
MHTARRFFITALEDHPVTLLAQIRNLQDGSLIQQSNLSSIDFRIFDLESVTPHIPTSTGSVSIVNSVFDTLQLDDRWNVDARGFNFAHTQPATAFNTGSRTYDLEYEFNPTGGANTTFGLAFTVKILEWRSA